MSEEDFREQYPELKQNGMVPVFEHRMAVVPYEDFKRTSDLLQRIETDRLGLEMNLDRVRGKRDDAEALVIALQHTLKGRDAELADTKQALVVAQEHYVWAERELSVYRTKAQTVPIQDRKEN